MGNSAADTELVILGHYRGRWPDPEVPEDAPVWGYFEVNTEADVVVRTVDVFVDGRVERNSIALEECHGIPCPSLVDGPFMETVRTVPLEVIAKSEFDRLYEQGVDVPRWNVGQLP